MIRRYLFNIEKLKYIKSGASPAGCILCAIRDRDPDVKSLEIYRGERVMVTVNLYPFTAGHLMVYPLRHVEDFCGLDEAEAAEMHRVTVMALGAIREEFNPPGFNIGYNLGKESGASIDHVHQHVVPRYKNEIGFLDVLAGARIMVTDPAEVMERLKSRFLRI